MRPQRLEAAHHRSITPPVRLFITALCLVWLQLFWALVPSWRFGEYYEYGWFVPFLAGFLLWQRIQMIAELPATEPQPHPCADRWLAVLTVLALLLTVPLRFVATADPGWRPPLLLHTVIVAATTQLLIWKLWGRRVSLSVLPVMLFALTAVPYPWDFEQALIRKLTGAVASFTHEMFLLAGRPVELDGERLSIGADAVEVAEGCSGIRSFQSLVMVAVFFGELLLLSIPKRLVLILVAGACSLGINTLRAYYISEVHFSRGKEAAAGLHDGIGQVAFLASAVILFAAARFMLERQPAGRLVVTRSAP